MTDSPRFESAAEKDFVRELVKFVMHNAGIRRDKRYRGGQEQSPLIRAEPAYSRRNSPSIRHQS